MRTVVRCRRKSTEERAGRIACIGAGPASLAAAAELRQRGFQVTVFEQRPLPGGLNTYGVAEYKLRTADSLREIELIAELGVEFRFGVEINDAAALAALERDFDVLFVGVGSGTDASARSCRAAIIPAVVDALKFIEDYKLGLTTAVAGRVVVVGAGNTAIDAARAAKRLGAAEVAHPVSADGRGYLRVRFEYEQAKQEGVRFQWLTQPVAVHSCCRRGLSPSSVWRCSGMHRAQ